MGVILRGFKLYGKMIYSLWDFPFEFVYLDRGTTSLGNRVKAIIVVIYLILICKDNHSLHYQLDRMHIHRFVSGKLRFQHGTLEPCIHEMVSISCSYKTNEAEIERQGKK